MNTVWILSHVVVHNMNTVIDGVYADKDSAKDDFIEQATSMAYGTAAVSPWQDSDGSVHAEHGLGRISLEPHYVIKKVS